MFKIGIIASAYKAIAAFLLDLFPNASAAYSLRKLRTAYTGSAIRVRRSNDNTEQNIGFDGSGNLNETALTTFVGSGNAVLYSEQFENAYWTKANTSITANTLDTLDPLGGNTADKVIETAANAFHLFRRTGITLDGLGRNYTASIYAKAGTRNLFFIEFNATGGNYFQAIFNLSTGTVYSSIGSPTTSIISVGNGWFRCSVSGNTNSVTNNFFTVGLCDSSGNLSYTGNILNHAYLWGAQLNEGSTAQTYVQTVANQAGFGFVTKWYDQGYTGAYNFFTYSEQFDNVAWTKTNTTATANQTTAPDGTTTADLIAETITNSNHQITQNKDFISGKSYTISAYFKKGTGGTAPDIIQLTFPSTAFGASQYASFNINIGEVSNFVGGTAIITSASNGFWRCSFTATATSTVANTATPSFAFCNNNPLGRLPSYVGLTTSNVFAWGAQLDESSTVRTYVQTVATAAGYRDAVQTTAANQPRIVNAGVIEKINGKPNINFGASTSSINMSADFNGASSASIFTVVNVNTISVALQGDNNTKWYGAIWPTNTNTTVYQNAGTPSFYKNGSLLTLTTQSGLYSSLSTGQILFTALPLNTSTWTQINTNLAGESNYGSYANRQELIIYNSDQSTNRTSIESNINSYYTIY